MNEFAVLWQQSDWQGVDYVSTDKGYYCAKVRNQISAVGKTAVIPRRKGAICPLVRDKERLSNTFS